MYCYRTFVSLAHYLDQYDVFSSKLTQFLDGSETFAEHVENWCLGEGELF